MKQLTLREIQLAQLEVLKWIKRICEKEDINYYLFYGTLIGAVRHKGFIPWDDDIDIVMFRPDYEKFIDYCKCNNSKLGYLRLHHYTTDKNYIYPIARLSDTRYKVEYSDAEDYGLGLFVDIYPLDGCGNSQEEANKILKCQRKLLVPICFGGLTTIANAPSGGFRTILKYIMVYFVKLIGINRLIRWSDKLAQRIDVEHSKYVDCVAWTIGNYKLYEYENFQQGGRLMFENEEFVVPIDYDQLLRLEYGNYMSLPPEKDRVGHHYFNAYVKDDNDLESDGIDFK